MNFIRKIAFYVFDYTKYSHICGQFGKPVDDIYFYFAFLYRKQTWIHSLWKQKEYISAGGYIFGPSEWCTALLLKVRPARQQRSRHGGNEKSRLWGPTPDLLNGFCAWTRSPGFLCTKDLRRANAQECSSSTQLWLILGSSCNYFNGEILLKMFNYKWINFQTWSHLIKKQKTWNMSHANV